MRDALEDREVGQRRQQETGEDDRLASDFVGQPAEQDEAGRADQERDGDHDLGVDGGHFQRLRQEEQRGELAAVPDHGFARSGAEQRQGGDLGIGPVAERVRQWPRRVLAFGLHAQEDRRFIELEPDPDRYREQNRRQQERDTPSPIFERRDRAPARYGGPWVIGVHVGAHAKDNQQGHEQAKRRRG